jgi:hypothetical protein
MARARDDQGQAAVELVAVLPFALLALAVAWQLAVAGQTAWLAGSAARAAARAHAVGLDPAAAARDRLPRRLERGLELATARDGSVLVKVRVPALIGGVRLGDVEARARFEPQGR